MLFLTVSLKGDCGNRIRIILVCWLLSATSTVDLLLSSLSKLSVLDLMEGLSLTNCLFLIPCLVTLLVIWNYPPVDWPIEDNQLVKSWRSWEIDVTLAAIFRNFSCCTDKSHCCFIGVGYWYNRTRERSKSRQSRGKYDVLLYDSIC